MARRLRSTASRGPPGAGLNRVDLFSGLGGGILAGQLLGWRTIAACEIDPWCRELLIRRQNDTTLPPFPIWDDVRTFPGLTFQGRVDVVSGGFPCQDVSLAGPKRERAQRELFPQGKHLEAERSGLWFEMRRVVEEIEPRLVFIENVTALRSRGLDRVLRDLASLGFDAAWDCVRASDLGAPHKRDRIWILGAHPDRGRCQGQRLAEHGEKQSQSGIEFNRLGPRRRRARQDAPNTVRDRPQGGRAPGSDHTLKLRCSGPWSEIEPPLCGVDDGPAGRVDQLRAIGNAQVPIVAAAAFQILRDRLRA